ncbi:MAG: flagellar motor switch protein FliN [Terriglobia bacterium]
MATLPRWGAQEMTEHSILENIEEYLKEALRQSLGSMTGQDFQVVVEDGTATADMTDALIWGQTIFPGSGRLWVCAGRDLWSMAGQLTLTAAGIDSVTEEDCQSTWQEIASQTVGGFCTILTTQIKREVSSGNAERADREPENLHWVVFTASCEAGSWTLKAGWTKPLTELCDQPEPVTIQAFRQPEPSQSKTFDLLLDVALPVSVSFGRTTLEIREVLKLTTGSIVELNRLMSEPVEVIVNDCVIARGEVVVINGNYGVRITELASREDRMKSGMADAPSRTGSAHK